MKVRGEGWNHTLTYVRNLSKQRYLSHSTFHYYFKSTLQKEPPSLSLCEPVVVSTEVSIRNTR